MKKKEVAQMLGITRQHLDFALRGVRNFGFTRAKRAAALFGGSPSIWQDPDQVKKRQDTWKKFQEEQSNQEEGS